MIARREDKLSDADILALAQSMRRAGVRSLEVDAPGQRLRLKLAASDLAPTSSAESMTGERSTIVKAESMGYFRATHPDGLFPAREVGATVDRAQILAFLQVGLLLLPVIASQPGRLARILAVDNSLVGYGTPLFEISQSP